MENNDENDGFSFILFDSTVLTVGSSKNQGRKNVCFNGYSVGSGEEELKKRSIESRSRRFRFLGLSFLRTCEHRFRGQFSIVDVSQAWTAISTVALCFASIGNPYLRKECPSFGVTQHYLVLPSDLERKSPDPDIVGICQRENKHLLTVICLQDARSMPFVPILQHERKTLQILIRLQTVAFIPVLLVP
jgi:hypothetical protein